MSLDKSHNAQRTSWVASAQAAGCDFSLQNLPWGRFRRAGSTEPWRIGVAIGDQILDLAAARPVAGWPAALAPQLDALAQGDLAAVIAAPKATRVALRLAISDALATGSPQQAALAGCLVAQAAAEMALPCTIRDYTDFYTGIHHATTVGKLFRPDNPLLPNYKWVPIGYHGRASSIVVSGTPLRRPLGQTRAPTSPADEAPAFGPCQRLDYELELGAIVAQGNALGEPVPITAAEDRLAGLVLLNDWSARDLQAWEYQPLGPFLAKNFGSTLSPWLVTMEALAPYRVPFTRPAGDPQPLPYLDSAANRAAGAIDITLEVWLQTAAMRQRGEAATRLSSSNFRDAYWTLAQLLTHHASNGCNLATGDLLGTGTQSGPEAGQGGSLLELSMGGKQPLALPGGETRSFLADGDTLTLRAFAQQAGGPRVGFGACSGTVLPAPLTA
ncbi:fumarylacetoacetase [Aquabacterium sp. OR-4]|uniref:fumarylacetoacetase n=1 Tax=Aquabacterium sp. OR-4 TaxID=2978127 RepID=UPI0028C7272C|nr:fumarylacetoacetase [Aquabacterium sp. OR-4]MDT7838118.1 fumarylacetoacetase [Aquabacterium sp. OR-4]